MYLDIGFFVSWYATAELALTATLAASTGTVDLEAFDILCRGMDARKKLERLRLSAKRHGGIGPNIRARFDFFEKKIIPLRNKIVHSSIAISEDDGPTRYWLSGIANLPWAQLGMGQSKTGLEPYEISSRDLYSTGVWLSFFRQDLSTLPMLARARVQLEIDNPRSRLPEEVRPQNQRKAGSAKTDKRTRTERGKP
jgi:hypothetical protein